MTRWRHWIRHPRAAYASARRQVDKARDVVRGMSLDLAASTEVRQATLRALADVDDRMRLAEQVLTGQVDQVLEERPELADPALRRLIGASREAITPGLANFLDFEDGANGFRAQAGLWINAGIVVRYFPGDVQLHEVNERIVEVPYGLAQAQLLPAGARIVDVGACDSTLALSLAALGYDVTALDVRPYPFAHPNLTVSTASLMSWEPAQAFDAALCISTIEHVGLGWYGDPIAADGDREALTHIRSWLRPGGTLVLTVPFGDAQAGEHQRTYDAAAIDKLLHGWVVDELRVWVRDESGAWAQHDCATWDGVGVALIRAHRD